MKKEYEEKYRELFENTNEWIYTHDLKEDFLTMNQAVISIWRTCIPKK